MSNAKGFTGRTTYLVECCCQCLSTAATPNQSGRYVQRNTGCPIDRISRNQRSVMCYVLSRRLDKAGCSSSTIIQFTPPPPGIPDSSSCLVSHFLPRNSAVYKSSSSSNLPCLDRCHSACSRSHYLMPVQYPLQQASVSPLFNMF